ncbi:MAG: glucose-6-phosphate dehydrogenase [Bacteroidota bacterium]|nr:glucose-6-phosphate dehydrogenase [Bacteroidota bacterium]MDP4205124.1 glucose-6-phosphate dehydrogenase [Bacteroidota bacterium]
MKKAQSLILVIFGASGDLTRRKLIPALYDLHKQSLLSDTFAVLGVSRTDMDDDAFRDHVRDFLPKEDAGLDLFLKRLYYLSINTSDVNDYSHLRNRLERMRHELNIDDNYIFYLSTPPILYEVIPSNLAAVNLNRSIKGYRRLIVEKPFGTTLESAKILNQNLLKYFKENQIYRIDHYLGKETVQNLLVTRFSNAFFEPIWNRNYIHHVEISAAESLGVEKRGGYYDNSGAMRDMVQNHLLQLLGLVAMEPPVVIDADSIRDEVMKVFRSLTPIKETEIAQRVIRGQYIESQIKGETIKGYRQEEGVPSDSRTETFVAMKFFIDNWRWGGVPFYIRTGKRLPTNVTEVVIRFKPTPHHLFHRNEGITKAENMLVIRIQPDEGIVMRFGMKVPGAGFNVQNVGMDFHYSDLLHNRLPTAYERLLLDCMQGDATLYARGDAVESAWSFIQPILNAWENNPGIPVYGYPAGSWGPEPALHMVEEYDWRFPCKNLSSNDNYCEL